MSTGKSWSSPVDALWLAALAIYIMAGAASVPFHGDESTLIFMGRDFHYLFVEGDLTKIFYDRSRSISPAEQHLRLLNGTVSKTIYGWLAASNGFAARDLNQQWDWSKDYEYNQARGSMPDADLLRGARLASALQLALAVALFFQFLKLTLDRPTAYLASALFALHPNVLINGRRAMMEGSHLLGLMLVLLAATWLLRERRWWKYVLLGVCAGLAVAAKHPNVIICALVFLACTMLPLQRLWKSRGRDWRLAARDLGGMAAAGLLACLVFLALNPAWWRAPLDLPALVLSLREGLLQDQVNIFGGYGSLAEQITGFFQFVFVGERQYFEVAGWADYAAISAQIEVYERSGLAGLLVIGSVGRLGLICLLLAIFAVIALARGGSVSLENRRLLLIWILGAGLATLWLTPLPWARYYLPLLPAVIVLVSYAMVVIVKALGQNLKIS